MLGTNACLASRNRRSHRPTLGDALNAGYGYLEVRCLGCDTHQTRTLDIVRRPKATLIHELERYMRCKDCSEVRGYPEKRSHLVALRVGKITGERSAVNLVARRTMTKNLLDSRPNGASARSSVARTTAISTVVFSQ